MIGECLARHEGIRCIAREDLLASVNRFGELATRVTKTFSKAVQEYEQFSVLRRPYQVLMKRALLEHIRSGALAYFGYSGHLLLNKVPHFVRVRLIAPMEVRIGRTQKLRGVSEGEARDYIHRVDEERTRWARLMYGLDIRDPGLYDLSLNIERLSLDGACRLLRNVTRQEDFQPTPESVAYVENDYIATSALAALVIDPRTHQLELGATVQDGVLRIEGPYLSDAEKNTVFSIVEPVPGVRGVEYEPGYAPAFRNS